MKIDLYQLEREKAEIFPNGLKVYLYYSVINKPILKMWKPKAINPFVHYSFKTIEDRSAYMQRIITNFDSDIKAKQLYKESKKIDLKDITIKKNDIFYTSWGYDQTNYDYIVVLEVSKTGKTAKCSRTTSLHMGNSCQSNVQEPIFFPFGETFNMRIYKGYQGSLRLQGSYPFLHTGVGSKRSDSFAPHTEGKQYHETMAGFGH